MSRLYHHQASVLALFSLLAGQGSLSHVRIRTGIRAGLPRGHALVIFTALCGLWTSSVHWCEHFADCMCEMGFELSKVEPGIWAHRKGDICEHVAVCVDDLAIAAKAPKEIADALVNKCNFELKGTGPVSFHLDCGFFSVEPAWLLVHGSQEAHQEDGFPPVSRCLGSSQSRMLPLFLTKVIILRWTHLRNLTKKAWRSTNP
jgi:hypothetical protein